MRLLTMLAVAVAASLPASAALVSVSAGPTSSAGVAPAIIAAPTDVLDDVTTNLGQEGFDEAQDIVTSVMHGIDGGGFIPTGTLVDSHMIFLNSPGTGALTHGGVIWEFAGRILGIMSDTGGTLEAASSFELGAPGTNYTTTFPGSGPAAPFAARGLEAGGFDGYTILGPTRLLVAMRVTEPGDWIRVVTEGEEIPEPGTMVLLGTGLAAFAVYRRRKRA